MKSALIFRIRVLMDALGRDEGLGVCFHSLHEVAFRKNGRVCDFCSYCLADDKVSRLCRYASCTSAINAFRSGEPSIQRCWAGLVFITVPVTENNACVGGISVGGFYFEGEDAVAGIREGITAFPERVMSELEKRAGSVRSIVPVELRGYASYLMESTFSAGINSDTFLSMQHTKYTQQRQIADALAEVGSGPDSAAVDGMVSNEQEMLSVIEQGDRNEVELFFSRYIAKLLTASKWNLVRLKARLRMLVSMLTTREILMGREWMEAVSREARNMLRLEEALTVEDSCYEVAQMIKSHLGWVPQEGGLDGGITLADRVTAWLDYHYAGKAALSDIAKAVGASESAVTKALKKDTGKTSRQLLREVRVAEARRLLVSTDLELSEIAGMCGFYDQSHFTRDFQHITNLTPGLFRKLAAEPNSPLKE